jgi:S1-C subfamily serine protease
MEAATLLSTRGKAVVGIAYPKELLEIMEKEVSPGEVLEVGAPVKPEKTLLGSGFIIDSAAIVVTNFHIVRMGLPAWVSLTDGRKFTDSELVDFDCRRDIAVLRTKNGPEDLPTIEMGDSAAVAVGDRIYAVGYPLGFENSISDGLVSGIREPEGIQMLEMTAPLSSGSSGGVVYDTHGKVIGISAGTYTGGENINFAIPINDLRALFEPPTDVR